MYISNVSLITLKSKHIFTIKNFMQCNEPKEKIKDKMQQLPQINNISIFYKAQYSYIFIYTY